MGKVYIVGCGPGNDVEITLVGNSEKTYFKPEGVLIPFFGIDYRDTVKPLKPYFSTWEEVVYYYNYKRRHMSLCIAVLSLILYILPLLLFIVILIYHVIFQ